MICPPSEARQLIHYGGLNANPVEPGYQGIVRLAHPYQLAPTPVFICVSSWL